MPSIKFKDFWAAVLLILVIAFLFQNTQVVILHFLFWKLSMPLIILVLLMILVGVFLGVAFRKKF